MRIALITDGIWPYVLGGMQKHSYYLCRYLARNKVHVDLYHFNQSSYDPHQLEFFSEQEKEFIHPVLVDMPPPLKFPGQYIYRSWLHSKLVYERVLPTLDQIDFIYTKGFTGWYLIDRKFKKKISSPPIGVNFHGYEMFQRAPDLKSLVQQWMLLRRPVRKITQHADFVFSYGGKITEIIRNLKTPNNRIIEMPACVEESSLTSHVTETRDPLKFVFLGRYERRKGIEELNNAISLLALDAELNLQIHFIGPIPGSKKLHCKQAVYHGEIRDKKLLTEKLCACDVLLCPSWSEGMPNVILEAMANGLTVVATDVGATSLLVNDSTGWLLSNSASGTIEKTLRKILSLEKITIQKKKQAALQHIQAFTWEKNIKTFLNFLLSSKH